jgi:glycosyltransferase involved in cell wall biosynthesis
MHRRVTNGSEAPNVIALIPAYNEERRVADVVIGASHHLPVLVVDDGSADATSARAREAGATVMTRTRNQGKGEALRAGFRQALAKGFDAVITLDADGQHDPAEIPGFLHAHRDRGADLIIGARDFSQMPLVRRFANRFGRWSFSWALGRPVRDNQSGYRLVSRRLMESMLTSDEAGFEFEVEMIVVCVEREFKLDWVSIRTIYAGEESHIRPLQHLINFSRMVVDTRRRIRRKTREPVLPPGD